MKLMPSAPIALVSVVVLGFLGLLPAAAAARQAPAPVAVLDAPATVACGHDITVSGARSCSPSAIIIKYIWTLDGGTPIETALPTYTFAADPAHPFAVGPHTVRLVVVDSAGFLSAPDSATVTVVDNIAPTARFEISAINTPVSTETECVSYVMGSFCYRLASRLYCTRREGTFHQEAHHVAGGMHRRCGDLGKSKLESDRTVGPGKPSWLEFSLLLP
jgi:hypothetical protein